MLIHLENENDFKNLIKEGRVLIDFYADWCGPCQMLAPILEQLANEDKDLSIIKINVDDFPSIAKDFHISSIPSLIYYKNGEIVKKQIGFLPLRNLKELIA